MTNDATYRITDDEIHMIGAVEMSHWWYRGTREICFALLMPYLAGRGPLRILDIGCGTGGNLLQLAAFGDARGIDSSPVSVEYCTRKGLACTLGTMSDLSGLPAPFDLVTMFDVLYQADPAETDAVLSGIVRVLAPGGLLVFREPAMPIAAGAHDRAVGVRQRFTKPGVASMLERAGLEPQRITYLNTVLFAPIVAYRRLAEILLGNTRVASDVRPAPGPLNSALLAILRLERWILRSVDLPFGVSVFAVARRPR